MAPISSFPLHRTGGQGTCGPCWPVVAPTSACRAIAPDRRQASASSSRRRTDGDSVERSRCDFRLDRRLEPSEAFALLAALAEAAAPARIDVLLETPRGGVSLADLAAMPAHVLVRTAGGPRLAADPWMMDADALLAGVS